MEVDDQIQCKFPRTSNGKGRLESVKLGQSQKMDDDEDEVDKRRGNTSGGGIDLGGGVGRFFGWPSSRIVRVSRASGGKDRHSKVLTSKGLRDRRVRLSVNTAIQFYDLQDRLGYDQPSKAVEWLLKEAASSIAELPPMNSPFPDTPKQLSDEKRSSTAGSDQLGFDSADVDLDGGDRNYSQQQVTKSTACSSNSETSKGSGLSRSRSESRIKARERAKGRVAEKEKNPISHTTSFTELLNGGINNVSNDSSSPNGNTNNQRHWSSATMDYFSSDLFAPPPPTRSAQMHLPANPYMSVASPLFSVSADHQQELQHFSFVPDHLVPVVNAAAAAAAVNNSQHHHNGSSIEYNLNFTISSSANSTGHAGFNRGTLQSNSSSASSLLPHLQRYSDAPAPSLFFGTADSHHQFLSGYDSRGLQLCYGDAHASNGRHSAQRGKGKN